MLILFCVAFLPASSQKLALDKNKMDYITYNGKIEQILENEKLSVKLSGRQGHYIHWNDPKSVINNIKILVEGLKE